MGRRGIGLTMILLLCLSVGVFQYTSGEDNGTKKDEQKTPGGDKLIEESSVTGAPSVRTGNKEQDMKNVVQNVSDIKAEDKIEDKAEEKAEYKAEDKAEEKAEDKATQVIGEENQMAEGKNKLTDSKVIVVQDMKAAYSDKKLKDIVRTYPAGTTINIERLDDSEVNSLFYNEKLSEVIISRISGKSYKKNCDIPYEELRYVRVLYRGFDEETHIGELIVNKDIAKDITDIFYELYQKDYPIEQMLLIDEYDAEDVKSMEANNTSAFNYRYVAGTTHLSNHSDGRAIDINPLYNPYITYVNGKENISPANGAEYADRTKKNPLYIREGDACYNAFIKRGFTWGGAWKNSKDYQHFQKVAEE